jgi:molybdate transport system ATP-binding protein
VFQEASLFAHLNVQANLQFGFQRTPAAQRRHRWDQGLELLGIGHLLQRMPHELSGGERQRVAIARALASSPRVLLLDEPLAALDAQRKSEILPWLEQLHDQLDIPVVYVTHSPDEMARLADQLVLLEAGTVRASGPVMDLMTRLDLPLLQGDAAAALIEARVCGLDPTEVMCILEFDGGRLLLPQTRAVPLPADTRVRVRIQARDVSLSLQQPEQTSVLNILPATVVEITDDGPGQVLVALQIGHGTPGSRLLSRISQLSARRLGITPGQAVYAQIKGVAMVR